MNTEDKKIEGHAYDGIEELDNSLPQWWLLTFYGTIVYAVIYFLYYVIGNGPGLHQEYLKDRAEAEAIVAKNSTGNGGPTEASLLAVIKNPERQKSGKQVFDTRCVSCHGNLGQGGIGPNLTDDYWIHGGKPLELLAIISNGVGDKGMPPWGGMLSQDDLHSVLAYVKSLKGTQPAGAKAPQGDLVKE